MKKKWKYRIYSMLAFILLTSVTQVGALAIATSILIASIGTAVIGGIFGAWNAENALDEQRKENRRAEDINLKLHGQTVKESARQFDLEFGLEEKGFKNKKQQQTFENSRHLMKTFTNAMGDSPKASNAFFNAAARRQAQPSQKIIGGQK